MASPFSIFRRNQKVMLAVICVMAMFAFVFLDPLFKYLGQSGGPKNPVVVEVNSHAYRATELMSLVQSRLVVRNFLHDLALAWVQKAAKAGQLPGRDIAATAENVAEIWQRDLMQRAVPPENMPIEDEASARQGARSLEEAAAIETLVLAARGEEAGIVLTDQAIIDYLKGLTGNMISAAEYETIVRDLRGEAHNMSQSHLFNALRRELLAQRYDRMFQISLRNFPPGSRWEYFQKLERRATAEIVGIPVERYVKDVSEPSDSELKAFFQEYAETLPVPNSPTPGFKRPIKAQFQYIVAKFDDFNEKAMAQVTPEEMHAYYDKNKDIYYQERKQPPAGTPEPGSEEAKPGDTPSADKPSGDASGSDKPKGPEQKSEPSPTPPPAVEGEKKPSAAPAGPSTDADKKSSRSVPASRLHLVAQKTEDKKPSSPPADATPADAKPADEKPASEKPASEKPTDEKPADEKPAADTPAEKSGTDEGASSETAESDKPAAKPAVVYEPFEKVEDEIRKKLAEEKADKLILEAFQRMSTKMRDYGHALNAYDANKEEDASLKPPTPLDLADLASAEGMKAHETDLVSPDELEADWDLGKSSDIIPDRRAQYGFREDPFVQLGFRNQLYSPLQTQDRLKDQFLSWKIKETPEAVPSFDEVRREVAQALKLIEARKLAVAAAEQLAKEARATEKPLSEIFADRDGLEVVETGPFTWMTIGPVPYDPSASPHLSEVHGVQDAGEEFMEAVFSSTPNQIRVAMNHPKTVAYVIQIKGFEPPREDLEQKFLVQDFREYARLAMNDQQLEYMEWLRWINRQAGLTWFKPAVADRRVRE